MGVKRTDGNLMFLFAVYLAALSLGNVLDDSYVVLFGSALPASVLAYPLTFLMANIICELWGRDDAVRVMILALSMKFIGIVLLGLAQLVAIFPDYGARKELWGILGTSFWEVSGHMVLGNTVRFWTASLISFPCAQLANIWTFTAIRNYHISRTGGPWGGRWVRYLCGALVGEAVETLMFLALILAPDWEAVKINAISHMHARSMMTLMSLSLFYMLTWRRRPHAWTSWR